LEQSVHFSWDDWFLHASSQQRADAFGLALKQGLLYPHQLPTQCNGVKTAGPLKELEPSLVVSRLLAGKADALPRLQVDALSYFDADLDELQRQAVARAICTPDLFLLQGLPGTGKSRVLTEILLQAVARGWRVLFLAGQTESLDVVLHRLLGRPEVLALRFLDTLEKPDSLTPWLYGLTVDEQKRAFLERVLASARGKCEQAESICRQRRTEEPIWADLQSCARRWSDCETQLHAVRDQLPRIAEAVKRTAEAAKDESTFFTRLAELRDGHEAQIREIEAALHSQQKALAKCEQEVADLAAQVAARKSAYLAKKYGRWWTLSYWLNLFNRSIIQETEVLLEQLASAQERRQEEARRLDEIAKQKQRWHEKFNQEYAAHVGCEIEARRQELLHQQQVLETDVAQLDAEWQRLCARLGAWPGHKTTDAVVSAHQAWQQKKNEDEEHLQFAQKWLKFLEEAGVSLAAKLPHLANVLAGTIMRWHTDAKFREAGAGSVDVLLIEDAETLTEAEVLKLSGQAKRCVLVAQSLAEPTPAPSAVARAESSKGVGTSSMPFGAPQSVPPTPLVSAACWSKLWHALGGEAGCWPCAWRRDENRLVCQLVPLGSDDRPHLESEGLADAPDIELRILHRPRSRPCLAQVIFAPHGSFADAFHFMVREVQEFPLQPLGRTGWWSEDSQRHYRNLGLNTARIQTWLEIEPGLRLGTVANEHGDATRTACLEFDKNAGWDRGKAEAWLLRYRPIHDHERTVFLQAPYRFAPPLAQVVQSVVRAGEWLTAAAPAGSFTGKGFEFIAVPALDKQEWPREGAGLELDLAAPRHLDRLPVGLRQGLPGRGFVNYLEAQALIRRLETWLSQRSADSPRVAVMALYEGQVALLRRLIEQSEILRAGNFPLEVALPSRLHQRECDVVFLSLTRSHAHRCVAFGEDLSDLPLALTRARGRLLVFGDPGSLCKRTNWHGPLEHLDAQSAHQERMRLVRLLAFLQKSGSALPKANGVANGRE
jgi:hypothetical protein